MKTTILALFLALAFTVTGGAQVLTNSGDAYVISGPGYARVPAGYAVQFEVAEQHKGFGTFTKQLKQFISTSTLLYARQEEGAYKYRLGNFQTEEEAVLLKKQVRAKTRYNDAWVVYDAGGMPALPVAEGTAATAAPSSYEYLAARSPSAAGPTAYAIQLGAYEVRPGPGDFSAIAKLGVVYAVKEGRWYKARLGGYATKDAATAALKEVHKSYPKAYVIEDPNAASLVGQDKTAAPAAYEQAGSSGTYTVKKGDTLFSIAQKAGMPVYRLRELNQLAPGAVINPGQVLRIR